MGKRILTLDDLYNHYSNYQRSTHYSCINTKKDPIVVQTRGSLIFNEDTSFDTEGLMPVRLQACHTECNLNSSSISYETMNDMLSSFANRPILGYIHEVNGEFHFKGHEMHEEDGEIVYDEVPVGVIPETNNISMEYDEENDRYNVMVDGWIYENYSKACEILEREQELSVSVELTIREMSYQAKEQVLVIEDAYFSGITILGVDDNGTKVKPGMEGSNVTMKEYIENPNIPYSSVYSYAEVNNKLIETLEKLDWALNEKFNINDTSEKGGTQEMNLFEELLKKYNKTTEDVTFEYEGLSDEELENAFKEAFGEIVEGGEPATEPTTETAESTVEPVAEPVVDEGTPEPEEGVKEYSRTFTLSQEDVRCGLYNLLAEYESADNDWYCIIQTFDNSFIYQGMFSNKIYSQNYFTGEDGTIKFEGEREERFAMFVSAEEKANIESMRTNYEAVQEELNTYKKIELNAQKEAILSSVEYAEFLECEEFVNIKNNLDSYSLEELKKECDLAFASCVKKKGNFNFSAQNNNVKSTTVAMFGDMNGNSNKPSFLDGLYKLSQQK